MTFKPRTFDEAKANYRPMKRSKRLTTRAPLNCKRSMKRGTKRLRPGRRMNEWSSVRAWLKTQFAKKGIRTCQLRLAGCFFDNHLGFAHPAKRRELKDGELYVVALLCNPCHDAIETGPREEMRRIVERLFALTEIRIPK